MKRVGFWPRAFSGSVLVKTLFLLFTTMVLACGVTFCVMFLSVHGRMYSMYSERVELRAQFLIDIYENSSYTPQQLAELYGETVDRVELYDSFDQLPPLTGVIWESELKPGQVYLSAETDLPLSVIKLGDYYLQISVFPSKQEIDLVTQLLQHTLLLCALVASICTIFVLRHSVRPLTKLNIAIREVGRGNFDVQVQHKGEDEIARIVENFNWMVGKLRHIEALQHDFVSSVSHEFKTPIAAISGSAKLLSSTPHEKLTRERVQKYTGLILEETARMSSLSSNLLQLSKVENQNAAENLNDFQLDEQIRQAILLLETQWSAKQLQLEIQLEPVVCRGNEELLIQVWINLLSNAIKFTSAHGQICVTLTREMNNARIRVTDSGIGMDAPTRARLFERFFQGDSSRSAEGNGLGLSIVKRILDLHGAQIIYESVVNIGTTCIIILPISL